MRRLHTFTLGLIALVACLPAARADADPPTVAEQMKRYWKRARFECRRKGVAAEDVQQKTVDFRSAVVGIVEDGVAIIREVNPELMTALLDRTGWWAVDFSCSGNPGGIHAKGQVETRGGRKVVALGLVHPALLLWADSARNPYSALASRSARRTVLHEFLHTIEADNLPREDHNSILKSVDLQTTDVVYACSGFVYFDIAAAQPDLRFQMCRTCALARFKSGRGVSLATSESDIAAAERACAELRDTN